MRRKPLTAAELALVLTDKDIPRLVEQAMRYAEEARNWYLDHRLWPRTLSFVLRGLRRWRQPLCVRC